MNITRYNVQSNGRDLVITSGTLDLSITGAIVFQLNTNGIWTAAKAVTGRYRVTFNQAFPFVSNKTMPIVHTQLATKNQAAPAGAVSCVPGLFDLTTTPKTPTLDILTLSSAGVLADVTVGAYLHFTVIFSNTASP
jgi:hypothetical protein